MTGQEVLRQLLPAEVEVPTSFETIGHVLHLNLKEQVQSRPPVPVFHFVTFEAQHAPYERVIADVLLDKVQPPCRLRCAAEAHRCHVVVVQVPNARTIVSKVGTIQNKFRVYDMKV